MDDANTELEASAEPLYDDVRRPINSILVTNGCYTELFTGSVNTLPRFIRPLVNLNITFYSPLWSFHYAAILFLVKSYLTPIREAVFGPSSAIAPSYMIYKSESMDSKN